MIKKSKNDYDERSAGGIVFRKIGGRIQWLLIRTKNYKKTGFVKLSRCDLENEEGVYKFPKGHLKENEHLKQAAIREVEEEAQVKGEIICKIGSNDYVIVSKEKNEKIVKKVTFFLMRYVSESKSDYKDMEVVIGREWLSYDEAIEKLAYEFERGVLRKAKERLEKIDK